MVAVVVPPFSAIVGELTTSVNAGAPSSLAIDAVAEAELPTDAFVKL